MQPAACCGILRDQSRRPPRREGNTTLLRANCGSSLIARLIADNCGSSRRLIAADFRSVVPAPFGLVLVAAHSGSLRLIAADSRRGPVSASLRLPPLRGAHTHIHTQERGGGGSELLRERERGSLNPLTEHPRSGWRPDAALPARACGRVCPRACARAMCACARASDARAR